MVYSESIKANRQAPGSVSDSFSRPPFRWRGPSRQFRVCSNALARFDACDALGDVLERLMFHELGWPKLSRAEQRARFYNYFVRPFVSRLHYNSGNRFTNSPIRLNRGSV